jgi:outer membrane protein, adhesin transport system
MRLFIAIFYVICNLNAEDSSQISIESLIQHMLSSHPHIQSSREAITSANAQVESAKWNYFPTPSVDVSMASGRRGSTIRLDQPLWTGGKNDATYDIAVAQKDESFFSLQENSYTLIEMLLKVIQNYVQANISISALEDGKKQLEDLNQMLNRRIDAGVSSLSDQELITSRLSQINADLAVAKLKKKTSHAQLELLVGGKLNQEINGSLSDKFNSAESLDILVTQMIKTHPSLKKISAQIQTAEAEKTKAKAILWPNVSLRAEHQSGSVYYDQSQTNNVVYVALSASTGAGFSALSNIQSAESRVMQLRFTKLSKERELTDTLYAFYNDYRSAQDRIHSLKNTIDASQNVLDSYARLFIAGKRQWLDLVNSSREVTQNTIALADAKASLITSAYRLALQTGKFEYILENNHDL